MANTKDTGTPGKWLSFLAQQGAITTGELVTSFGETAEDYSKLSATLSDLGNLGILALEGPDTKRFLQGQSTSDCEQLSPDNALPGAICNAKGRMLTSYQAVEAKADTVLLVMQRPLVDTTINNLGKYAAFFKTTLSNASEQYHLLGISGPNCESVLSGHLNAVPTTTNQLCIGEDYLLLRISAQQFLLIAKVAAAETLWLKLAVSLTPVGIDYWELQSIRAGLAQVHAETLEQFVPQMLNLQATGAISFKKGCYTGQEIVARMQYLGKLKRRTYRVIIKEAKPPKVGTEIYASPDNKLVGSVLMTAPTGGNSAEMLALLHEDQAAASAFIIDGDTIAVEIAELPYSLTDN